MDRDEKVREIAQRINHAIGDERTELAAAALTSVLAACIMAWLPADQIPVAEHYFRETARHLDEMKMAVN